MQRYDIPEPSEANVNGLKDFLVNHGGLSYFDEITAEWVDNAKRVTTLTKNGAAITISEATNNYPISVNGNNFPNYNSYGVYRLRYGYMTDAAIVLVPCNTNDDIVYPFPIVICKTQKGYACVFHPLYNPNDSYTSKGYGQSQTYTITRCYIIDDDGNLTSLDTYHYQDNCNARNVLTTAPLPGAVDVAKDVYYVVNRPFYQTAQPFSLDIDGESYASFAYNTILIKTT